MNKTKHYAYITTMCVVASMAFGYLLYQNINNINWMEILFWGLLAIIAESFLIILPNDAAASVGMAIYLAALVTSGPLVAVTSPILAFIFRMPSVDGERRHLFKYSPSVILYNISSHVIIIGAISILYVILDGENQERTGIIWISLLLLTISELISIVLISIYFNTKNGKSEIPLIKSFLGALPSTWAVGALGLFLAFAEMSYGRAIVGLFFVPLLLTRYSFKLYFDSQKMGLETIEALNEALHVRDAYTSGHTERVEEYSVKIAKALNYSGTALDKLRKAARLHDIGKIGIPDGILNKPGQLSSDEYEKIKDHSAMGSKILGNVDSLKSISEIVRYHHERPDGKGYPDGLTEDKIPRDSAILSIADTYDAMTSDRPYRKALDKAYAISEFKKFKGTQFNTELVEVFIRILEDEIETVEVLIQPEIQEDIETKEATEKQEVCL